MPHRVYGVTAFVLALVLACGFSFALNSAAEAACTPIATVNQLQAMRDDPAGNYCLTQDIDAGNKPNFVPVGNPLDGNGIFTGRFDGRGHAIRNLKITSDASYVGLFAITDNATIINVRLLNVRIVGSATNGAAGGLVGVLDGNGGSGVVRDVHVSGTVTCTGGNCAAGGIVGGTNGPGSINLSSSAANVAATARAGGALAGLSKATVSRTYATGSVRCTAADCMAGGLIARATGGIVLMSFATGNVTGGPSGNDSRTGGLIAYTESGTTISRCFATGTVTAGAGFYAAGLIAQHNSGGDIAQVYSAGRVSGSAATLAGLIANAGGTPSIVSAYWDTETSGQASSSDGVGLTTAQLRAELPGGFGTSWAITKGHSYPFINDDRIDFASPLATFIVGGAQPLVLLPIDQNEDWEYGTEPAHANQASLAAVYTMIARAVGPIVNDHRLVGVKIDRYFWNDATQRTFWRGPVKNYSALGGLSVIPPGTPMSNANVIGRINAGQAVVLRGTYTTANGTRFAHWMLGTGYTRNPDNSVRAVIADDPFTGRQVKIDPATKRVTSPAKFPLKNFRVNGYRPVTLLLPVSDRRLKRDIVKVGRLDNGLSLYRYRYRWDKQLYVGVMAQEVALVRRDAVMTGADGYLRVDYARLGTQLQTWQEWLKSSGHRDGG